MSYIFFAGRIWIYTNTVYNIQTVKDFGYRELNSGLPCAYFSLTHFGFLRPANQSSCQRTPTAPPRSVCAVGIMTNIQL